MKKSLTCNYTPNPSGPDNDSPSPSTSSTTRQNVEESFDLSMLDGPVSADVLPPRFGPHAPSQVEKHCGSPFYYTGDVPNDIAENIRSYGQVRMLQDPAGRLCETNKSTSEYVNTNDLQ